MISFNPKSHFQEMKDIAASHRDLVVKNSFTVALEMAMLEYQMSVYLDASSDPIVAAAQAQRLCGAQQFIDILLKLGEIAEVPKKREIPGQLDKRGM